MWGDVAFLHGWHIQRNVFTGHYRLLDAKNTRHAWGALDACRAKLEEIRVQEQLPPMKGEAVIVMHGLNRSHSHMRRIAAFLKRQGGYAVFNVEYPSSRAGVDQHAEQLAQVIASLEGIERIHFVAHSLGNLVIRRWLTMNTDPATGEYRDQRVGRFVMLGPPNHRPFIARVLVPIDPANAVAGQAGRDLQRDWEKLAPNLATPRRDFGILAGGKGDGDGWNPLISGDDDMLVGVDEAKLKGAADFRLVSCIHAWMPDDEDIQKMSLAFIKNGRFGSEQERQRLG